MVEELLLLCFSLCIGSVEVCLWMLTRLIVNTVLIVLGRLEQSQILALVFNVVNHCHLILAYTQLDVDLRYKL